MRNFLFLVSVLGFISAVRYELGIAQKGIDYWEE